MGNVLIYLILKNEALSGYLIGIVLISFVLIVIVSTCSISIRGAKKYFENELINIQNSHEYNSISVNDALFKVIKDIVVPMLTNLIKFMAILALALVNVLK